MERSYVAKNDRERARLRALVERLSDEDVARPLGNGWDGWTVGVALAHLAFWDRLWLAKLDEWDRTGVVKIPALETTFTGINEGMLSWWCTIAPDQARYEVVAAAEAVDERAAHLPEPLIVAILAERPRTVVRAVHRREHLGPIEQALGLPATLVQSRLPRPAPSVREPA